MVTGQIAIAVCAVIPGEYQPVGKGLDGQAGNIFRRHSVGRDT